MGQKSDGLTTVRRVHPSQRPLWLHRHSNTSGGDGRTVYPPSEQLCSRRTGSIVSAEATSRINTIGYMVHILQSEPHSKILARVSRAGSEFSACFARILQAWNTLIAII